MVLDLSSLKDPKRTKRVEVRKINSKQEITDVEDSSSITNMNETNMAELQDLSRRRYNAKYNVDLELEFVSPLLRVSPENANDEASRVTEGGVSGKDHQGGL